MEVRLLCTCASWRWFMAGSSGGASGASPSMSGGGSTEGTGGGRDGGEGEQRRGRGGKGLEDSGHGVLISRVRPRLRQIDEPRIAGPSRHASPFVAQIRFDLRPPQPSGARALPPRTSKGVMSWGGPPPASDPPSARPPTASANVPATPPDAPAAGARPAHPRRAPVCHASHARSLSIIPRRTPAQASARVRGLQQLTLADSPSVHLRACAAPSIPGGMSGLGAPEPEQTAAIGNAKPPPLASRVSQPEPRSPPTRPRSPAAATPGRDNHATCRPADGNPTLPFPRALSPRSAPLGQHPRSSVARPPLRAPLPPRSPLVTQPPIPAPTEAALELVRHFPFPGRPTLVPPAAFPPRSPRMHAQRVSISSARSRYIASRQAHVCIYFSPVDSAVSGQHRVCTSVSTQYSLLSTL